MRTSHKPPFWILVFCLFGATPGSFFDLAKAETQEKDFFIRMFPKDQEPSHNTGVISPHTLSTYARIRNHFNSWSRAEDKEGRRFSKCFSDHKDYANLKPFLSKDNEGELKEINTYIAHLYTHEGKDIPRTPDTCDIIANHRRSNLEYDTKSWALKEAFLKIEKYLKSLDASDSCTFTFPWQPDIHQILSQVIFDVRSLNRNLEEMNARIQWRSETISQKWSDNSCTGDSPRIPAGD